MNEVLDVFDVGSEVLIKGTGIKGVVEKIIIGDNRTISYQLICYVPERHQQQIASFEIQAICDATTQVPVGFDSHIDNVRDKVFVPPMKDVTIILDEDENVIGVDNSHDDVNVQMTVLSKEELKHYRTETEVEETLSAPAPSGFGFDMKTGEEKKDETPKKRKRKRKVEK